MGNDDDGVSVPTALKVDEEVPGRFNHLPVALSTTWKRRVRVPRALGGAAGRGRAIQRAIITLSQARFVDGWYAAPAKRDLRCVNCSREV